MEAAVEQGASDLHLLGRSSAGDPHAAEASRRLGDVARTSAEDTERSMRSSRPSATSPSCSRRVDRLRHAHGDKCRFRVSALMRQRGDFGLVMRVRFRTSC
jgi:Tfp pilus assembly pilus retraction ATPase PilT